MAAITIRDVPDDVKQSLAAEASVRGKSMQAFLLGILKQHAGFNRNRAMLAEIQRRVDALPPEERKELPRAADVLHAARREAGRE